MISFKQFLVESQNYPLYHGTSFDDLSLILKSNKIMTGFRDTELHWPSSVGSIVSTSRNYEFAKEWAQQKAGQEWAVIELDRGKLRHNYKIVPFNYFGSELSSDKPQTRRIHSRRYNNDLDMNQYEEAITKDIKPVLKYIKFIYMSEQGHSIFKNKHSSEYSLLVRHGLI